MKTALIVVDVQNFFLHDVPDSYIKKVAKYVEGSDYTALAFTIFKNEPNSNFVRSLKWPKCRGGKDIELPAALQPFTTKTNVFIRPTFSGFESTKLHQYLKRHKIEKVVICGMDADACVLATAFSAFDRGYIVEVNESLTISQAKLKKESMAIIKRNIEPN